MMQASRDKLLMSPKWNSLLFRHLPDLLLVVITLRYAQKINACNGLPGWHAGPNDRQQSRPAKNRGPDLNVKELFHCFFKLGGSLQHDGEQPCNGSIQGDLAQAINFTQLRPPQVGCYT